LNTQVIDLKALVDIINGCPTTAFHKEFHEEVQRQGLKIYRELLDDVYFEGGGRIHKNFHNDNWCGAQTVWRNNGKMEVIYLHGNYSYDPCKWSTPTQEDIDEVKALHDYFTTGIHLG
jgi:hypothetical protein